MIIKKESKQKIKNTIMIIKQNGRYITVSIGLCMDINILNKEAKIQFIKQINEYIMKNIMKNTR